MWFKLIVPCAMGVAKVDDRRFFTLTVIFHHLLAATIVVNTNSIETYFIMFCPCSSRTVYFLKEVQGNKKNTKPTKFHRHGPSQSITGIWSYGIPSALRSDTSHRGWVGSAFIAANASTWKGVRGGQVPGCRCIPAVLQMIEAEWGR